MVNKLIEFLRNDNDACVLLSKAYSIMRLDDRTYFFELIQKLPNVIIYLHRTLVATNSETMLCLKLSTD